MKNPQFSMVSTVQEKTGDDIVDTFLQQLMKIQ